MSYGIAYPRIGRSFKENFFPFLEETVGLLTESHKALVTVVDMTSQ